MVVLSCISLLLIDWEILPWLRCDQLAVTDRYPRMDLLLRFIIGLVYCRLFFLSALHPIFVLFLRHFNMANLAILFLESYRIKPVSFV